MEVRETSNFTAKLRTSNFLLRAVCFARLRCERAQPTSVCLRPKFASLSPIYSRNILVVTDSSADHQNSGKKILLLGALGADDFISDRSYISFYI
jgi:hypothetical protein